MQTTNIRKIHKTTLNFLMKLIQIFQKRKTSRFLSFCEEYLRTYTKKDIRVIKQAYDKFKAFIDDHEPTPKMDSVTMCRFYEHLMSHSHGCGAASTFARFKKIVSSATEAGILNKNPCNGIKCTTGRSLSKDILSTTEILALLSTQSKPEQQQIRNAFIFCLYTGMRFCDIKQLRFKNLDPYNHLVTFTQSKISRSAKAQVSIPLREELLKLTINQDQTYPDALVFRLPSHTTCSKFLREWTRAAGISKHITWHCARHSFATNLLKNGADVRVVADLLGHSGLKYIETYTRVIDSRKVQAIHNLPPLP